MSAILKNRDRATLQRVIIEVHVAVICETSGSSTFVHLNISLCDGPDSTAKGTSDHFGSPGGAIDEHDHRR